MFAARRFTNTDRRHKFTIMQNPVRLSDRAVVSVEGSDAETFLQGLITNGVGKLASGEARYSALLAPQGKVIADFLIARSDDGFLLDVAKSAADDLIKRLNMFRLRAQVAIARRDDLCVIAFDGAPDPRDPRAPKRRIAPAAEATANEARRNYDAARIACGLSEQGRDFAASEVFPADVNMDVLNGVDFKKGCFVGQEVVSRMKRRGTARRRTFVVRFEGAAPETPCAVMAGDVDLGPLTSALDGSGLARLRADRLAAAQAAGTAIRADGVDLKVDWPDWLPLPETEASAND